MAKSPGGRPSKLTPELQEQLVKLIARGHYPSTAAAAVGVGESTYFKWMSLGEDHSEKRGEQTVFVEAASPYVEFREAVEKAKAEAQLSHMECIRDAAFTVVEKNGKVVGIRSKNWTASAWYLERTAPERYGRQIVEHQGKDGGPIQSKTETVIKVVRFGGRYKPDGELKDDGKS